MPDEIIVVILSMHLLTINRNQYQPHLLYAVIKYFYLLLDFKILYLCKYKNIAFEKKENKEHMVQI